MEDDSFEPQLDTLHHWAEVEADDEDDASKDLIEQIEREMAFESKWLQGHNHEHTCFEI